jgi:hypothetical protein
MVPTNLHHLRIYSDYRGKRARIGSGAFCFTGALCHHSPNGKEGLVQIGNSLDQMTNSAVRAYGSYAQG